MTRFMRIRTIYAVLAALALCACAKTPVAGPNDSSKLYFDSWIHVNYPNAVPVPPGYYVLSEKSGTGTLAGTSGQNPYVRANYVIKSLDGTVSSTSLEDLAKQVGTFKESDYYGPIVWIRGENYLSAGLDAALEPMRVGGTRTVVVPGWLNTTSRYDTEDDYLAKVTGSNFIFDLELVETITDIKKWETDSVGRYVSRAFPGKGVADSLKYGFYYFRTGNPSSEKEFPNDTTIYINYVARLLNGKVFDTNVKDTAKFYGLYSASRTYTPSSITWFSSDGTYADIKMGESSVIDGFSFALSKMHPHEKGAAVFYSGVGYGTSGSGSTIPAFAPLRFDIEIVDKP